MASDDNRERADERYDRGRDDDEYERPRRRRPRTGSNRTLWIVLGVVGCVMLGCGGLCVWAGVWGFRAIATDIPAASAAADRFLDQLKDGQPADAYAGTSEQFQAAQTAEEFAAFVGRFETLTKHTSRTTNGAKLFQDASGKRVTIQTTLHAPNNATTCTLELVEEDGAWKVDRFTVP